MAPAAWPQCQSVGVRLVAADLFDREPVHELDGLNLDRLDVECTALHPAPELLSARQPTSSRCLKCW